MAFESEAKAVHVRTLLKRSLTRTENYLNRDNISRFELISRQTKMPEIWKKFNAVREYLEGESHFEEHDEFEDRYYAIQAKIQELIDSFEPRTSPSNASIASQHSVGSSSILKLPPIELPTSKGDLTKYLSFRNTFVSLVINNHLIDNVQRLHYLLSSLQGEPKDLLDNLPICDENFDIAWNLIDERYNNKRLIIFQHVKHLLNLHNGTSGSFSDYRKLINQIKSNLSAIENLESETPLHEILLQELILNKIKYIHRG
ncbi:hypothetical protein C0J52_27036 [Blattella germanica]|nr:hypothetical protein C0J52_27036 [Blattella germanica]